MLRSTLMTASVAVLAACTSTPQVAVIDPRDTHLTCLQIEEETTILQAVMDEAHHNKGFNVANFFAVPFFSLAYYNNVLEADNAEEWVQRRRAALTDVYMRKGCSPGIAGGNPAIQGAGLGADVSASARSPLDSRRAILDRALLGRGQ